MKYKLILDTIYLNEYKFMDTLYQSVLDTLKITHDTATKVFKLSKNNNKKSFETIRSLIPIKTNTEAIEWVFLCGNIYSMGIMSKYTKSNIIDFSNKEYFKKNITILEATFILLGIYPNLANKNIEKILNTADIKSYSFNQYNIFLYKTPYGLLRSFFANNEYMPMGEFLAWALENKFLKKHQSSNTAKATETRKKTNIPRNQKIIKKYNTLIKQDKYKTNQSLVARKIIKDLDLTIKERAVKNIINTYLKKQ
jgi:hypothetical protein